MTSSLTRKALLGVSIATLPHLATANTLMEALQATKPHGDFRLRYESVDDGVNEDAEALTLRSRFGFTTGQFHGFSVLVEGEAISILGGFDEYAPNRPGYAVIADPKSTHVNRAFLRYQGPAGLDLGLGRQRIIYDNARFVGNVGWRQNEQTFDAFTAKVAPVAGLEISYAYLDEIQGITPAFDADVDSHLLNVSYSGLPFGRLTGYGYWLEDEDTGAENDTWGVRFAGSTSLGVMTLLYTAELATQEAGAFEADYRFIEAGVTVNGVTFKAAHEVLGSDGGAYGFQTPLATKHAFNGWADKFLITPDAGLKDTFLTLSGSVQGVNLTAVYHWYSSDAGSVDYGREWNLQAARGFGPHVSLGVKYARYEADEFSADTDKFWLWAEFRF